MPNRRELIIYIALLLSAASSLMYEVIATNILFFYFVESSYSIATVLSVFLFGLGLGSLLLHAVRHRLRDKLAFFVSLQLLLATYAVAIFSNLATFLSSIHTLGVVLTSCTVLLVPTVILGMVFPLSADLLHKQAESNVGLVYAVDLFGAVMGALGAGFVIIPVLGNRASIFVVALINILAAAVLLRRSELRFRLNLLWGAALLPAAAVMVYLSIGAGPGQVELATSRPPSVPPALPQATAEGAAGTEAAAKTFASYNELTAYAYQTKQDRNFKQYLYELLQPSFEQHAAFKKQSPFGEIVVYDKTLFIDRRDQCSLYPNKDTSEREIVYYALKPLESAAVDVLNIGLGCGGTLRNVLAHTTKTVDVVEINPVVAEANVHFGNVAKHERVNLIIDSGLQYLEHSDKKYDAIILDIENPAVVHASNLYTAEAFALVRKALNDDGVFGLWYNDCRAPGFLDTIFHTLKQSFDHVYHPITKVFVASARALPDMKEYRPSRGGEVAINTMDKKVLSRSYYDSCAWVAGRHYLFDQGGEEQAP